MADDNCVTKFKRNSNKLLDFPAIQADFVETVAGVQYPVPRES